MVFNAEISAAIEENLARTPYVDAPAARGIATAGRAQLSGFPPGRFAGSRLGLLVTWLPHVDMRGTHGPRLCAPT